MPDKIEKLTDHIRQLQEELEQRFEQQRANFRYEMQGAKVRFSSEIQQAQRKLRITLGAYLRHARLAVILTAPVIYSVFVALVILDVFVTLYQFICFPAYGIPKVRRRDHIALDRHHLQYLNGIEKLNCIYCGYANGLLSYAVEIASRTEQFWCPIKHARRVEGTHARYPMFFDYGDGAAYRDGLGDMRKHLKDGRSGRG